MISAAVVHSQSVKSSVLETSGEENLLMLLRCDLLLLCCICCEIAIILTIDESIAVKVCFINYYRHRIFIYLKMCDHRLHRIIALWSFANSTNTLYANMRCYTRLWIVVSNSKNDTFSWFKKKNFSEMFDLLYFS